jgi:PAS domain-containing protein
MKADADSIYHRSVALYLLGESPGGRTHVPHWLLVLFGASGAVIAGAAIFIIWLRHRHRRLGEVLSATEIRFDAMFENAAVGLATADIESKKFTRVNPRFCEMLGYSESLEERFVRKDRAEVWGAVSLSIVGGPDVRPRYWIGAVQDITRRKNQEHELERHREHLEELVEQRTQEEPSIHATTDSARSSAGRGRTSSGPTCWRSSRTPR